jgi:hypothetical protein
MHPNTIPGTGLFRALVARPHTGHTTIKKLNKLLFIIVIHFRHIKGYLSYKNGYLFGENKLNTQYVREQ